MMRCRIAFSVSLWGVLLFCAAGCTGKTALFPVKGVLKVGNKPAGGAQLAFHAVDQRFVSRPTAITEADGTFQLRTLAYNDGAPAGDYVVTIFWHDDAHSDDECDHGDPIEHDRFHGFYVDSTKSPLRASVRRGSNEITIEALDPSEVPAIHPVAQ